MRHGWGKGGGLTSTAPCHRHKDGFLPRNGHGIRYHQPEHVLIMYYPQDTVSARYARISAAQLAGAGTLDSPLTNKFTVLHTLYLGNFSVNVVFLRVAGRRPWADGNSAMHPVLCAARPPSRPLTRRRLATSHIVAAAAGMNDNAPEEKFPTSGRTIKGANHIENLEERAAARAATLADLGWPKETNPTRLVVPAGRWIVQLAVCC